MPKPFTLLVAVEEVALGPVMAKLHNMPGVVKVDMLLGDTKGAKEHANGHANGHAAKQVKPTYQGDQTAEQFVIKLLKKKPMKASAIHDAFEKEGRAGGSYASAVWQAKKDGLVQQKEERGDYSLTKKGHDRARFV